MNVKAFRERWKHKEPFKSAAESYAKKFNLVCDRNIDELLTMCPMTEEGYHDLRGFDFCLAAGFSATFVNPELKRLNAKKVDFSGSQLISVHIRDSRFEDCNFSYTLFQGTSPRRNHFINCDFTKSHQFDSSFGTRSSFKSCNFTGMKTKGNNFSFGSGTTFKSCEFLNTTFRDSLYCFGIVFEDCIFSGSFHRLVFYPKSPWDSGSGALWLIDKWKNFRYPFPRTTFLACDLSSVLMDDVLFKKGVVLEKSSFPESVISNEEGLYFGPIINTL